MKLHEHRTDGIVVLQVNGRIDSTTSRELNERLTGLFEAGCGSIVLDVRDCNYVSSAGLRVLLIAAKMAGRDHGKVVLSNVSAELRRLLDMSGFLDFFLITPSWEAGVAACRA